MTERSETVLAVDPGKKTGLAMLRRHEGQVWVVWSAEADEDETIPLIREHVNKYYSSGLHEQDTVPLRIVCEIFKITPQTGKMNDVHYSLEQIGALKQYCRDSGYPVHQIVMQRPADAKSAFTNTKLKRLGLWHRGGAGHALDAIRHAALYLVTSGWRDELLVGE